MILGRLLLAAVAEKERTAGSTTDATSSSSSVGFAVLEEIILKSNYERTKSEAIVALFAEVSYLHHTSYEIIHTIISRK